MKVIQVFLANNLRNFNYIVYSEDTSKAIFFDPTDLSMTLHKLPKGIKPEFLINTHDHYDHIQDNKKFLEIDGTMHIKLLPGSELALSKRESVRCISTPGHVREHYCYELVEDNEVKGVITGDTVFNAGVGNCRDGGDPGILFESIRDHFIGYKDKVLLYPSHDYFLNNLKFALTVEPDNGAIAQYIELLSKMKEGEEFLITTVGEEKLFNPFFRVFNKDFNKGTDMRDLFIKLRSLRDKW